MCGRVQTRVLTEVRRVDAAPGDRVEGRASLSTGVSLNGSGAHFPAPGPIPRPMQLCTALRLLPG